MPANEWVELGGDLELKTPGANSEVCLEPASPFAIRDDFSIAEPDGVRLVPKVRLVSDGGEYPLELTSLTAEALCLGATVSARLASEYRGVRIWSPARLSLKRVQWNSSFKSLLKHALRLSAAVEARTRRVEGMMSA